MEVIGKCKKCEFTWKMKGLKRKEKKKLVSGFGLTLRQARGCGITVSYNACKKCTNKEE